MMRLIALGFSMIMFIGLIKGQETTGYLSGTIVSSDGETIPSATLALVNLSTNEKFYSTSQFSGKYTFLNVTPATYTLEVRFLGFDTYVDDDIKIQLGKETVRDIMMVQTGIDLGEVTVVADRATAESEQYLTEERIKQTPTIFRSIQELQRTNPENNLNSFQGASNRFNNLNIDGVATNDIIGFQEPASGAAGSQANGTPGSLAKTQPIGFGAIKELSTKTTPFDVSIGNFNGASINVITKSGTNDFKSSIFGFLNNRTTTGKRLNGEDIEVPDFSDYQVGFNTGGPVIKDKLFYFANAEFARSNIPLVNNPGSLGSNISLEDVQRIRTHLIDNFDYDPGAFESASNIIQSSKFFLRFDYLINDKHKLTLRNNFVTGFADNLEWSQAIFNFGNQGFRHNNTTNSTVLELKSNFGEVYNKFNISFNRVVEGRTFEGRLFPHIQIATSSAARVFAGTYREASVFNTDFNTFQLSDKISVVKDNHTLSAGVLVQLHDLNYGFLSAWNGRWEYSSVENFLADRPRRVRGVYNVQEELNTFDFVQNNPAATIGVLESALYAQDRWDITPALTLQYGLRVDGQLLTRDLPVSPLISESPVFNRFTNDYSNNFQINPRTELSYHFDEANLTVHAGTGLFSGRLPYLWFAYIDYISGTDYFNIDIRPDGELPLVEQLSDLTALQPGLTEINLLDPDFKYPRDWKTNVGLSWKPAAGWNVAFDFSYTDVVQGINRNEVLSNFSGADNRLFFDTEGSESKIDNNFTNVFLLTNTTEGFRYNATLNVDRNTELSNLNVGYSYGLSKDVSSTVRSSPAANFEWNQAIFGNDPAISFSNHDLRHKISIAYARTIPLGKNYLSASLLYNGRSGSPFSFVYQGDPTNDGSSRNDLIYVPADASEITLIEFEDALGNIVTAEDQWRALDSYISGNAYLDSRRGDVAERNGARTPWNHSLDGSLNFGFNYVKNKKANLRFDVFNILNLVNSSWGNQFFVPNVVNSSFSLLAFEGLTEDNTPTFSFNVPEGVTPWLVDGITSRWRLQVGIEIEL